MMDSDSVWESLRIDPFGVILGAGPIGAPLNCWHVLTNPGIEQCPGYRVHLWRRATENKGWLIERFAKSHQSLNRIIIPAKVDLFGNYGGVSRRVEDAAKRTFQPFWYFLDIRSEEVELTTPLQQAIKGLI